MTRIMHHRPCRYGGPILFLHGMPTSGRLVDPVADRLET